LVDVLAARQVKVLATKGVVEAETVGEQDAFAVLGRAWRSRLASAGCIGIMNKRSI